MQQITLSKRINELMVLAVLEHGPAHGYQIALSVEERTGGTFSFQHGTLYPILHRLEDEGRVRGMARRGPPPQDVPDHACGAGRTRGRGG